MMIKSGRDSGRGEAHGGRQEVKRESMIEKGEFIERAKSTAAVIIF